MNEFYILKVIIRGIQNKLVYRYELNFSILALENLYFKEFFWDKIIEIEDEIEEKDLNLNLFKYRVEVF